MGWRGIKAWWMKSKSKIVIFHFIINWNLTYNWNLIFVRIISYFIFTKHPLISFSPNTAFFILALLIIQFNGIQSHHVGKK